MFYQRRVALLRSVEVHNNVHMRATIKKQRRTTGLPSKRGGCPVFCVLSATAVALCLDPEAQRTRHTRRSKVRRRVYQAAMGDLFCVLCLPSAMTVTAPAFTLEGAQREEEVARVSPESVVVLTHFFVFTAHIRSSLNSRENGPFEFRRR